MDFSQEAEKPMGKDDQIKEAWGEQPRTEIDEEAQQKKKGGGRTSESAEGAPREIEEQGEDDLGRESQMEMAKELEEERAEMARLRRGKAKELPRPRTKGLMRQKEGPTIREQSQKIDHVLIESSDEAEGEFTRATSFDMYSDEINVGTIDVIRQQPECPQHSL